MVGVLFGGLAGWFKQKVHLETVVDILVAWDVSIGNAYRRGVQRCHKWCARLVSGMINGFINSINWATGIIQQLF